MKQITINGRECWCAETEAPTDVVILLHALLMPAIEMFGCVRAQRFAEAGIMAVCPPSENLIEWNYDTDSKDFYYLDTLFDELKRIYPAVRNIHLAGFSDGGAMVVSLLLNSVSAFDSATLVCASIPKTVEHTAIGLLPDPVTMIVGSEDLIVPMEGNTVYMSTIDAQAAFDGLGGVCKVVQFHGGHCWPGGVPAPMWEQKVLGPWADTPDATKIIIDSIKGITQ